MKLASLCLVEEVGVGVFDAACRRQVVVGDWEAVGVRVVDGCGAGDQGFGALPGWPGMMTRTKVRGRDGGGGRTAPKERPRLAQVGGPLGGVQQSTKNRKLKTENCPKLKD